jgi:uncharacterized protein
MPFLRFDTGPRTGERVPLDKNKVTFGRAKTADCIISHPTVSREHFVVERNNGKVFLVDRGSENGTHANGERVSWVELNDGDKIQAGPFTLVFEASDVQQSPSATAGSDLKTNSDSSFEAGSSSEITRSGLLPSHYLKGIEHFNAGRYFDAHEVWEEIWLLSAGDTKVFYQMLIQAAVGLHHYERGNARGAQGMYTNVIDKLSRLPAAMMSLDLIDFSRQIKNFFAALFDQDIDSTFPSERPRPQIRLLSRETTDWSL